MTDYIDAADQAKLIRKILKEAVPGVKFHVRTSKYSGGASITVSWTDGPNAQQIDAFIRPLAGGYFDGMTDYRGSRHHMLDGRAVHFGADFIFTSRCVSGPALQRIARRLGIDATAEDIEHNRLRSTPYTGRPVMSACGWAEYEQDAILAVASKQSDRMAFRHSPTRDRIVLTGDDGYGHDATGPRAHLQLVQ